MLSLSISIYFLCTSSFSPSSLSSLFKLVCIFVYFCCPLFLANPILQNIFINMLSFQVFLLIQALRAFLFFFIVLSFLLIQALRTSSLICCPLLLANLSFHNIFIFFYCPFFLLIHAFRIFSLFLLSFPSLLIQAFRTFSFDLQIFFNNFFVAYSSRLCKGLDRLCLLSFWCICFTLPSTHNFLFHFEVAKVVQKFTSH